MHEATETVIEKLVLNIISLILPRLLSLIQQNSPALLSAVEILQDLLRTKHSGLEPQLQTLLLCFLELASLPDNMAVRIAALKCILYICQYPTHTLLPYKQKVVQKLAQCVDDPKRLVRQAAVGARSRWFLVGAPGEPTVA